VCCAAWNWNGKRARIAAKQQNTAGADDIPACFGGENGGAKTYVLQGPVAAPTTGQYWALWKKLEQIKPGLSRHALTQKALGLHPKVNDMTPAQLGKMIDVFGAIIRDAKEPAHRESP
jgi:hypothetical protein